MFPRCKSCFRCHDIMGKYIGFIVMLGLFKYIHCAKISNYEYELLFRLMIKLRLGFACCVMYLLLQTSINVTSRRQSWRLQFHELLSRAQITESSPATSLQSVTKVVFWSFFLLTAITKSHLGCGSVPVATQH